jgi:tetratricopeptide (TPR) repeat protein
MNKIVSFASLCFAPLLIFLAGCSRDPAIGRQKYIQSGIRYMEKDKVQEAVIQFQNAIKLDPRSSEAFYQLGKAHLANRDSVGAYAVLRQAAELDPNRLDVHAALGEIFVQRHMFTQAEKEASLMIGKDPSNAAGYQLLGLSLAPQLQTEKAFEAFSKSVQLEDHNAVAHMNLGLAAVTLKRYADAETNLRHAIALDRQNRSCKRALRPIRTTRLYSLRWRAICIRGRTATAQTPY